MPSHQSGNDFKSHAKKTHFHKKGFPFSLVLISEHFHNLELAYL